MVLLRLERVSKRFAGVAALSDVSLEVVAGAIVGLIGPNGAGKSTLFNVITGVFPASDGRVLLDDQDITRWSPTRISRAGVARTFQTVHLFPEMSVLENVLMGQSRFAVTGLLSLLPVIADRREAELRTEALDILDHLGLTDLAELPATDLPYALQRKNELARALASKPRLLLLDEPAAGFNEQESAVLTEDIRRIRDLGIAVIVIEHDMAVIMDVCERITVLNFGELLAEGTPDEIQRHPGVIEAYLGQEGSDERAPAAPEPVR